MAAIVFIALYSTISASAEEPSAPTRPEPYRITKKTHDELKVSLMQARMRPTFADCNGNAIADSIDIAEEMEDDLNHNGIADDCDPDTSLCVRRGGNCLNQWKAYASRPDTSYFVARHKGNGTVLIRYTVPLGTHAIRLEALQSRSEESVLILSNVTAGGSYTFSWDKRGSTETSPLPPGIYTLRLTIETKQYLSRVRWR